MFFWNSLSSSIIQLKSLSHVQLFVTPWTLAYQALPSMGFSRQEYWSGLPFPSPGDLPNPGIEPGSPALQTDTLLSKPPGKPSNPADVGNLIFGSYAFSKSSLNIWFTVHVLLMPGLENFEHYFTSMWSEYNCAVVWAFFGIPLFRIGMKTDLFQSCGH